jgi:hypothetical protein
MGEVGCCMGFKNVFFDICFSYTCRILKNLLFSIANDVRFYVHVCGCIHGVMPPFFVVCCA